jgi:flavin-binding protein dodecin
MSLDSALQTLASAKSSIDSINSLKQSATNALDQLSNSLQNMDVLKVISNEQLQECVDILGTGGIVVNKTYPVNIVPYPRPQDFKKYMTDNTHVVYPVYIKMFMAVSSKTQLFAQFWLFSESLWMEPYDSNTSSKLLLQLLPAVKLTPEETTILQSNTRTITTTI